MTRYYRKSKRRSRLSRVAGKLFPSIALVLVGSAGFYVAMGWFRQDAEDAPVLAAEEAINIEDPGVDGVSNRAAGVDLSRTEVREGVKGVAVDAPAEVTAPLVSAYDGQHTGRVQRYLNKNSAEMIILAHLPALDMAANSYHVWLLKDGLADVHDMGELAPRADGSWILNFTVGPTTGIADPSLYTEVVITREPNDNNPAPSGNTIAEAEF